LNHTPEKKIYFSVITALEETPRELWTTSANVTRAFFKCRRVGGIVRGMIIRRGVNLNCFDDVMNEVVEVMQMKMLAKLDNSSAVYTVLMTVVYNIVSNYGKKSINTFFTKEISISQLIDDDDDEHGAMERFAAETSSLEEFEITEARIDRNLALNRFAQKMRKQGWPADIPKERGVMGRPRHEAGGQVKVSH
jgi:hypothetical protein